MSRLSMAILLLVTISIAVPTPSAQAQPPTKWAIRLDSGHGPEAITNLQFYFHDIPSGSNPSAVTAVKPVATSSDPNSFFGAVVIVDDPLTETSDPGSKLVGRAQGMYTFSSRNDSTILMSMSFGFTDDGPYNGSSLSVVSRNVIMNPTREVPVLGGTGRFRMARGYAVLKTFTFNTTSGDAVVNCNFTVYTPAATGAY